jgi:glucose-fructose oxidoreductase
MQQANHTENGDRRTEKSTNKVRYAVVGLGYISQAAVLPAFAHARENSDLVALVSGDPRKLQALSRKYKVAPENCYDYEHYADCLMSGKIDAVYIALPNQLHKQYTEDAARAGKHILCEKPMAVNEAECESMIQAADEARVKLMIAYRLHFERGNLEAIKIVNGGKIGEARIFASTFSQQVPAGNSRLRGGDFDYALYDMGTYCINAARYLFRAEPTEVFAVNRNNGDARFKEIPEMTSAIMKFPGERIATFTTSFGAASNSVYEVLGTKGGLRMDPAYSMSGALAGEVTIGKKKTKLKLNYPKRDQFAAEIAYFSDCILKDKEPQPSGREGLADVTVIRAIVESAKTGVPVKVSSPAVERRPGIAQEIRKAPAREPEMVHAAAPSR